MTPTGRTLALLRAEGYVVCVAEAWLPHVRRRRDLFGFADLAAVHPHLAGPLLLQVTTADHLSSRMKKVRESEAAKLWLRAGGRIECHGWERKAGGRGWSCRRIELRGDNMLPTDLSPRPRRRGKQRGLFDRLPDPAAAPGSPASAQAANEVY